MNHVTKPAIRATPTTPPMTPPAIAPAFELLLEDDGAGEDVLDEIIDWLLVELGTLEALPVTSGESVTRPMIHKRRGSLKLACIHTPNTLRK